jgi:hypothetical protein
LNTTLTPHSIIHGDACFPYFNKKTRGWPKMLTIIHQLDLMESLVLRRAPRHREAELLTRIHRITH